MISKLRDMIMAAAAPMEQMMHSAIRPNEAKALSTAVDFMTAGEADGVPQRVIDAASAAAEKITNAPDKSVWVPFSQQELHMLYVALDNGAEGILQSSAGTTSAQKRAFRGAANRVADAASLVSPRF